MDSDEVNSITDTVEAQQVATVIRSVYYDIIARADLPEHYSLVTLDPSGDNTKPVLMYLPSTVSRVEWIKYNRLNEASDPINMVEVYYLPLHQFLDMMHGLNEDNTDVGTFTHTVGADTFTILYKNDGNPNYYTTFDDNSVVFDSYDATLDTTLQKSKTLCYAKTVIPFTISDSFVPDLDEEQFALLLNESLSTCWAELKQSPHPIAERNSRRNWTHLQKSKNAVDNMADFHKLPDFGRIGTYGYGRYWPGKFRER